MSVQVYYSSGASSTSVVSPSASSRATLGGPVWPVVHIALSRRGGLLQGFNDGVGPANQLSPQPARLRGHRPDTAALALSSRCCPRHEPGRLSGPAAVAVDAAPDEAALQMCWSGMRWAICLRQRHKWTEHGSAGASGQHCSGLPVSGSMSSDQTDRSDRSHDRSSNGATLSVPTAASELGISEATVRRWIRSGKLPATQVNYGQRHTWHIPADAIERSDDRSDAHHEQSDDRTGRSDADGERSDRSRAQTDTAEPTAALRDALRMIERQGEQIAQLSGQVGFLQAQVQEKDRQLTLLQPPPDDEKQPGHWWRRLWPLRRRNVDVSTGDGQE